VGFGCLTVRRQYKWIVFSKKKRLDGRHPNPSPSYSSRLQLFIDFAVPDFARAFSFDVFFAYETELF
jgi:hypothetical protein